MTMRRHDRLPSARHCQHVPQSPSLVSTLVSSLALSPCRVSSILPARASFLDHAKSLGGVCGCFWREVQYVSLIATFASCSGDLFAGAAGVGTIGFVFTKGALWRLCRIRSWGEQQEAHNHIYIHDLNTEDHTACAHYWNGPRICIVMCICSGNMEQLFLRLAVE